jgi:hypothetical protein
MPPPISNLTSKQRAISPALAKPLRRKANLHLSRH